MQLSHTTLLQNIWKVGWLFSTAIIFVLTSAGNMHFHMDELKVNTVSKLDENPLHLSQTNYIYSALNYPKKDKNSFSSPEAFFFFRAATMTHTGMSYYHTKQIACAKGQQEILAVRGVVSSSDPTNIKYVAVQIIHW